jgi:RNA polymerase sigma factor (sigma-70 family)
MSQFHFPDTSATLLSTLRRQPGDADAWARFVRTYGPRIHRWCQRWGLQEADAQDVTQSVLLGFLRRSGSFEYDHSRQFRGWLHAVAYSSWREVLKRRRRGDQGLGGDDAGRIEAVEARDDVADLIEAEYSQEMLRGAMEQVRARIEPRTWEAFRLLNIEGLSGQDAASRLGMKLGSAYAASAKVRRLLREALRNEESSWS